MSPYYTKEITRNSVSASNRELFSLVGRYISHYKRLSGATDKIIALRVGCSREAITNLRNGVLFLGSITFVSHIAEAFGLNFVQLIDEARRLPA